MRQRDAVKRASPVHTGGKAGSILACLELIKQLKIDPDIFSKVKTSKLAA